MSSLIERVYRRMRQDRWHLSPGQVAPSYSMSVFGLPRYAYDRISVQRRFKKQTEDAPWITADSLELLAGLLKPSDVGVEFGSGGSTTWFAARVHHLYSVESSDEWHQEVVRRLEKAGTDNVSYHLASRTELGVDTDAGRGNYVNFEPDLEPGSQDFVFVDGDYRDECALRGIELLRPGGVLILDNANNYLPNTERSPWKVSAPASPRWAEFAEAVANWRSVWTTNGVWETAFWFKPTAD